MSTHFGVSQDLGTATSEPTLAPRGKALRAGVTGGSPLRAYQDLAFGTRSYWDLVRYELLAVWGSVLPGTTGFLFRKLFWPRLFAEMGRGTIWGHHVVVRHPGKMLIGSGVVVDDGCYLDAKGCAAREFMIGDQAMLSRNCLLSAKEGSISISERVTLGVGCVMYSFGGIEIGADTMIAAQCYIGGGRYEHRGRTDVPMHRQPIPGRGVVIEDDCWLGAGVTVIDGVRIGRRSVVGAGAVVVRDVLPGDVVAGVPALPLAGRHTRTGPMD